MNHPWFSGVDWKAMESMKVEALYIPPLSSESDTQFFSKEFTDTEILNPEEVDLVVGEQLKCDEL